jgi:ribosomal-protein-alanine N-acetyltransferase
MGTLLTRPKLDVYLRWMVHRDLPRVVRISRQQAGLRWAEPDFLSPLRAINTIGYVAELGDRVVGYMVYRMERVPQAGGTDEDDPVQASRRGLTLAAPTRTLHLDLLNIGVTPELQRRGIGSALLGKLEQKVRREGGLVQALVPETNLAMQLFLRAVGYQAILVLHDYFGDEDGYLMELSGGTGEPRE